MVVTSKDKAPHVFVPYVGSKFRHVEKVFLPLVPEHNLFVEVFGGSGSFIFNKPRSKDEILNDYAADIYNLFHVVAYRYHSFIELLSRLPLHSRRLFKEFKDHPFPFDSYEDIDYEIYSAVRTFLMQWNSFSGNGRMSNPTWSSKGRYKSCRREKTRSIRTLETLQFFHSRLSSVTLEQQDCCKLIDKYNYPDTFLYLDPPYLELEDYYGDVDISLHMRLFESLEKTESKWMLSYNNHPVIKKLYADYDVREVELWYTAALQNNSKGELLILNYDPDKVKLAYEYKQPEITSFFN